MKYFCLFIKCAENNISKLTKIDYF